MIGKKGKTSAVVWLVGAVVVLFIANQMGWLSQFAGLFGPAAVTPAQPSVAVGGCPDSGLSDIRARLYNPLNSTLDYVPDQTVYIYSGNSEAVPSITSNYNWASSGTDPKCPGTYTLYTLPGNASGSAGWANAITSCMKTAYVDGASSGEDFLIACPRSSALKIRVIDSSYNNVTHGVAADQADAEGWCTVDCAFATAKAVSSGQTLNYKIQAQTNVSMAQFGSEGMGVILCADFDTSKFSKSSGISVTGGGASVLANVPEGTVFSTASCDKAWKVNTIKSTDGIITYDISLKADLGDPTTDIVWYLFDEGYFRGTTAGGPISKGYNDYAGNDLGNYNQKITFDLS